MNEFIDLADSLFGFVVESSLAACMIVAVTLLLQRIFGARFSPRWRCLLWGLLIVRLMLPWTPASPFSAQGVLRLASHEGAVWRLGGHSEPAANRSAVLTDNAAGSTHEKAASPAKTSADAAPGFRSLTLGGVMRSVWLAGCLLFGLHVLTVSWRMSRSWRPGRPVTDLRILGVFEDCRRLMKVRGRPVLLSDDNLVYPVVCGIVHPRLIVPNGMLPALSDGELRHVFLHELGHLRRRDLLVGLLATGLQAMHWFNPLVWYGFHRMRQDREFACDALVLSRLPAREADAYGHTLVKLMENRGRPVGLVGAAAILEHESQLRRRIEMIAQRKASPYRLSWMGVALIALCAISMLTRASEIRSGAESPSPSSIGEKATAEPTAILARPQEDTLDANVREEWLKQGVSSDAAIRTKLQEVTVATLRERMKYAGLKDVKIEKAEGGRVRVYPGETKDPERVRRIVFRHGGVGFHIVATAEETVATLKAIDANPKFAKRLVPLLRVEKRPDRILFALDRLEEVRSVVEEINGTPDALPQGKRLALGLPDTHEGDWRLYLVEQDSGMSNITFESDAARPDERNPGRGAILFELSSADAERFGKLTTANIRRGLAIVFDGIVHSAPTIQSRITKNGQITGNYTIQEASDLAAVLRTKPLPARLQEEGVTPEQY